MSEPTEKIQPGYLVDWGFDDPDSIGASEYRAIYELLEDALVNCEEEVDDDPKDFAATILNEVIDHAQAMLYKLQTEITITVQVSIPVSMTFDMKPTMEDIRAAAIENFMMHPALNNSADLELFIDGISNGDMDLGGARAKD